MQVFGLDGTVAVGLRVKKHLLTAGIEGQRVIQNAENCGGRDTKSIMIMLRGNL